MSIMQWERRLLILINIHRLSMHHYITTVTVIFAFQYKKVKSKWPGAPNEEPTTTVCGRNYQLLAVMLLKYPMGNS